MRKLFVILFVWLQGNRRRVWLQGSVSHALERAPVVLHRGGFYGIGSYASWQCVQQSSDRHALDVAWSELDNDEKALFVPADFV